MRPILTLLFFITLVFGCENSAEKTNDCNLGQPTPIFSDTLSQVQSQQFELNGQTSLETIVFKNGIALELAQSGCEQISQEFQFKIKNIPDKSSTLPWIEAGISQFKFLSSLGAQFAPFFMWATSMEDQKEQFTFNTPLELGPGFFVTFNKVPSTNFDILIVRLHTEG
ncbi:MAG: hypothetical protein ACI9XO_002138 [Paraglaciecola sp.]|jgi:hypothetical protein